MNRRTFLASLFAVPAGVALAVKAESHVCVFSTEIREYQLKSSNGYPAYQADSRGIHKLLNDCGNVVEKPLDLDEIFQRVYELKRHRDSHYRPEMFVYNEHGNLIQIT